MYVYGLQSGDCWFEPALVEVEIYQHVINLFKPVLTTGSTKAVHVTMHVKDPYLSIVGVGHCVRPLIRLLSIPVRSVCAEQGR